MKKLIVLASLLLLGASSSYAWQLSAFNGEQKSDSVTVPTAGTFTMQAYTTAYGFAVAALGGQGQVLYYPGYTGQQYKAGSIAPGTYTANVSTTQSGCSAVVTVTW